MATKIITVNFTDGSGMLALTPTINVFEMGISTPSTQVITDESLVEVGLGWYRYDFGGFDPSKTYAYTVDGGVAVQSQDRFVTGSFGGELVSLASSVWDEQAMDHVSTGSTGELFTQIKADTSSILLSEVALTNLINTVLKYSRNRTRIDLNTAQMFIYDDDNITPLTVFNLVDFNGMPNVQQVCEKIPVI